MGKYRSREAPVKGSSVSETHPGFWADHIKKEDRIVEKWGRDYGHLYYDKKDSLSAAQSGSKRQTHGHGTAKNGDPRNCKVSPSEHVAYLKSRVKEEFHHYSIGPRGTNVTCTGRYADSKVPQPADGEYGYSSHYECQKVRQPAEYKFEGPCISGYGSPYACQKFRESWHSSIDKSNIICGYSTPGNVQQHLMVKDIRFDFSLSQNNTGRSWGELCQRSNASSNLPDGPERCPKCRLMSCVCVPCRPRCPQEVPEERGNGPDEELPLCHPSTWVGPVYCGNRPKTEDDIVRLCNRLTRDPDSKTSMNRMYHDLERKQLYNGTLCHTGPNPQLCPPCDINYDAECGTWFNEQLRKGNPFTTGDTQYDT